MADQDVRVTNFPENNSPEEVAFKLMKLIADAERRESYGHGDHPITREWVLKTYEQCLHVAKRGKGEDALKRYQPESFAKPGR